MGKVQISMPHCDILKYLSFCRMDVESVYRAHLERYAAAAAASVGLHSGYPGLMNAFAAQGQQQASLSSSTSTTAATATTVTSQAVKDKKQEARERRREADRERKREKAAALSKYA